MEAIHKDNAIFLVNGDKQYRCFGIERRFSKRLGKQACIGIGQKEFNGLEDAKNYALRNKERFLS